MPAGLESVYAVGGRLNGICRYAWIKSVNWSTNATLIWRSYIAALELDRLWPLSSFDTNGKRVHLELRKR